MQVYGDIGKDSALEGKMVKAMGKTNKCFGMPRIWPHPRDNSYNFAMPAHRFLIQMGLHD